MTNVRPIELRPIALGLLCDALLGACERERTLARVVAALNARVPPEARLEAHGLSARFVAGGLATAPFAPDDPPWVTFAWRIFEAFLDRAPVVDDPLLGPVFGGLDPDAMSDDEVRELAHFISSYEYTERPACELRRLVGLTLLDTRRTYDAPSRSWPRAWRAMNPDAAALTAKIHKRGGLLFSWPEGEAGELLARWSPPSGFAPHATIARELVAWINPERMSWLAPRDARG